MNKAPAFQFYANDWLSSPRIMLMTPAQEGAYIRLLCIAWNDPDCSIPDDDQQLAVLSRLGEGWLNGGSVVVRQCFEPHPDKPGRLVNTRLLEERAKQQDWREKSRAGGIKSGESRRLQSKGGSTVVQRVVEPKGNSSVFSLQSSEEEASRAKARSPRPPQICDDAYLTKLQANDAYRLLDVRRAFAKMCVWCEQKGKQPTRARLINWLNREDMPMASAGNGHAASLSTDPQSRPAVTAAPPGWKQTKQEAKRQEDAPE